MMALRLLLLSAIAGGYCASSSLIVDAQHGSGTLEALLHLRLPVLLIARQKLHIMLLFLDAAV